MSYPPGGPVDVLARPLAEGLQKLWGGSPVIVENKPGANAIIGTDYVAKQPGDGYTLLLANDPSLSSNQYLFSKLPYDPVKDLVPVATMRHDHVDPPHACIAGRELAPGADRTG